MSRLERLHSLIAAVAPIDGVADAGPGQYRVDYRPEATAQQRSQGEAIVGAFDPSDASQQAWEADRNPERKAVRQSAEQVVADMDTYLALASPTNAQVVAQVRRLS